MKRVLVAAAFAPPACRSPVKSELNMKTIHIAIVLVATSLTSAIAADVNPEEAKEIAKEAYIYGYSPTYAYRFLHDEVYSETSENYIGAFNKPRSYQRLNTPEDTMITPNVDTPYTRIWLDLRAEPIVVSVPKISPDDRYYVLQAISLDHYNLDFMGTRTVGQEGGRVVYVGPRYTGTIPEDAGRVVISPTDFVYLQGRILVKNSGDMKNVVALQNQIKVQALSEILNQPAAKPSEVFQPMKWSNNSDALSSIQTLQYLAFLLPYISLHEPSELAMLRRFEKVGIIPGQTFRIDDHAPAVREAIAEGVKEGINELNETMAKARTSVGLLGSKKELNHNYLNRAAGVGLGIFGNSPAEAMYFGQNKPEAKAGEHYILRFSPPPLQKGGFWSITMYNLPGRLVFHNPIERYAIGNRSEGLKFDAVGQVALYLQSDSPGKDSESNWLPTPKEGPFFYVFRVYLPGDTVQNGTWNAPTPELLK